MTYFIAARQQELSGKQNDSSQAEILNTVH